MCERHNSFSLKMDAGSFKGGGESESITTVTFDGESTEFPEWSL
ncbi:MAG: hypothetical protein OXT09_05325 [Myxococcales bacterium]|nr:hypothetical protein [Myxococcales bacterium]